MDAGGTQQWKSQHLFQHLEPSRPICFDYIFDGPPAYRTARVDLSLQLEAAVVAQTHVSTGVDDGVHLLVEANGAFSVFSSRGQLRGGESGRDGRTEGGAGSRHWRREKRTREASGDGCSHTDYQDSHILKAGIPYLIIFIASLTSEKTSKMHINYL